MKTLFDYTNERVEKTNSRGFTWRYVCDCGARGSKTPSQLSGYRKRLAKDVAIGCCNRCQERIPVMDSRAQEYFKELCEAEELVVTWHNGEYSWSLTISWDTESEESIMERVGL